MSPAEQYELSKRVDGVQADVRELREELGDHRSDTAKEFRDLRKEVAQGFAHLGEQIATIKTAEAVEVETTVRVEGKKDRKTGRRLEFIAIGAACVSAGAMLVSVIH